MPGMRELAGKKVRVEFDSGDFEEGILYVWMGPVTSPYPKCYKIGKRGIPFNSGSIKVIESLED